jgi:NAD(P)H-flavin reductase
VLPASLNQLLAAAGWTLRDNVAARGVRRLVFLNRREAPAALRRIARQDKNTFRTVGIVVARNVDEMNRLRSVKQAHRYPRALFTNLEEIGRRGETPRPTNTGRAGCPSPPPLGTINSFPAKVLANLQVGNTPGGHYRLAFRATGLETIQPPQFFMMDVEPKKFPFGARTINRGAVDWQPRPMLKRPFGLCRIYPPGFPTDWLKRIQLPATLTPLLYPPFADHFDLLYKVLPDGVGTRLMTDLKRGDKIHMVGPLGLPFDVRQLRAAGVEEVHIIGGGVGMAPLILLVEALRFHGFRMKVFLGMATLESLRYRDELAATFGEKPRDAYIYLDDLLAAGVAPADIFLACDREAPRNIRRLPKQNVFHGLVPEQYRQFLAGRPLWERPSGRDRAVQIGAGKPLPQQPGKALAFTCGPNRMMEVMTEVCRQANVPLKVLLEKRMGCGFGVCFSCVQKVRRADGTDDYVRICREGPMFDAKDILWNTDSKPNLEACGCKARC